MPYTPYYESKGGWQVGTAGGTPIDAAPLNNLETQFTEASQSFEQDLFAPFVLMGLTCVRDGVTATKLDLAAGTAFVKQLDGTLRRRAVVAQSFVATVVSATYFLDLNPDGTLSWATAHSGQASYMPLAQVTTDASANISTVTDERPTTINLFPGSGSGGISINGQSLVTTTGGSLSLSGTLGVAGTVTASGNVVVVGSLTVEAGAALSGAVYFGGGSTYYIGGGGAMYAYSYRSDAHPSSFDGGTLTTDGAGNVTMQSLRVVGASVVGSLSTTGAISAGVITAAGYQTPLADLGQAIGLYDDAAAASYIVPPRPAGHARVLVLESWDGVNSHLPFAIGGPGPYSSPAYVDNAGNISAPTLTTTSGATLNGQININSPVVHSGEMQLKAGTYLDLYAGSRSQRISFREADTSTRYLEFHRSQTTSNNLAIFRNIQNDGFGWTMDNGTQLMELRADGNLIIGGNTFFTHASTYTYAAGQPFDGFDVGEVYACDANYPAGTVLCPSETAPVLTTCTHDACPAAVVVSNPGYCIGVPDPTHNNLSIALTGRVLAVVNTPNVVKARQMVTSDASGGVRAMTAGESNCCLGFALADSANGQVGIFLRPMWVSAAPGAAF